MNFKRALYGITILLSSNLMANAISIPTFVSPTGNDSNNGNSWATAKRTIGAAITSSSFGPIWVAAGTYQEHITLKSGTALYGGFAGTETSFTQRNYHLNRTIIDGNLVTSTVTIPATATSSTIISGFEIINGSAQQGGGIRNLGSPTISDNIIRNNHCIVNGNGAAIYNYNGSPAIANNFIYSNTASGSTAVYFQSCTAQLINNTIVGNDGMAVNTVLSTVTVSNNIVAFNSLGGIFRSNGTVNVDHNCLYGNGVFDYKSITASSSDILSDPQLVNVSDIHLLPSSPCVNAGNNSTVPNTVSYDIDNQARIQGGTVDMGADENDGTTGAYVKLTATIKLLGYGGSAIPLSALPVNIQAFGQYYSTIHLTGSGNTGGFTLRLKPNADGTVRVKPGGFLAQAYTFTVPSTDFTLIYGGPSGQGLVPGDVNNDNIIDDTDLLAVINNFLNAPPTNVFDTNGDNLLDDTDLLAVINNFLSHGD